MKINNLQFDELRLAEFCHRYSVVRLSLFGSMLRENFSPGSDVDILVEFRPATRVSLFDLGGMTFELSEIVGRSVDLRTPQDLSRHFRDEVMQSARLLYAA